MNEHFVTCTMTSLHKLALFFIVLVKALWIDNPHIQNLLIIVFKTINNYQPEYLRDPFKLIDNINNLRGVNKLQVPKPNYDSLWQEISIIKSTWRLLLGTRFLIP